MTDNLVASAAAKPGNRGSYAAGGGTTIPGTTDQAEVLRALAAINDAWTHGRPEDAAPYFHRDMVSVQPGFRGKQIGAEAFIESYRDFLWQAEIHAYHETEHAVDVWGDTGVVSYRYEIDYSEVVHSCGSPEFGFRAVSGHRKLKHLSRSCYDPLLSYWARGLLAGASGREAEP